MVEVHQNLLTGNELSDFYTEVQKHDLNSCSESETLTIDLRTRSYTLTCENARRAYDQLAYLDKQDGKADGIIQSRWALHKCFTKKGSFWGLQIHAESIQNKEDYVAFRDYLGSSTVYYSIPGLESVIHPGEKQGVFENIASTAFQNGWTLQDLKDIKNAFENENAEPFFFVFQPYKQSAFGMTSYNPRGIGSLAKKLGVNRPYYFQVNLAKDRIKFFGEESHLNAPEYIAEHEALHAKIFDRLAELNPGFVQSETHEGHHFESSDHDEKRQALLDYFLLINPEFVGGTGEVRESFMNGAFLSKETHHTLNEAMVIGYHYSMRPNEYDSLWFSGVNKQLLHLDALEKRSEQSGKKLTDQFVVPSIPTYTLMATVAKNIGRDDINKRIEDFYANYCSERMYASFLEFRALCDAAFHTLNNDLDFDV